MPGFHGVGHVERQRCGFHYRNVVHTVKEEDACDDKPEFHGDRKIEDNREKEREQQCGFVRERHALKPHEFAPIAHIPSHEDQNCSKRRERNTGGERSGGEDNEQKRHRVHHSCDGRESTGLDVRYRSGDCACCRNAAEERHNKVSNALPHQLLIGVVSVVGHRVCNAGAEQ